MLYRLLMTSQLSDEDKVWPHEREDTLMIEFNKDRAEKRLNMLYYLGRIGATSGTPEDEVESEMEDIAFSAAEQGLQFHWRMGNWTLRPITPEEQTAFQEATKERAQ